MSQKKYYVIGNKLKDKTVIDIHNRLKQISKTDASFKLCNIHPAQFDNFVPELHELDGYMVDAPYKQQVIQYMDKLSRTAKLYGTVDVVENSYLITGHTIDAKALLKSLKYENINLGGRVAIYGMGPMATTLAYECNIAGANTCLIANRSDLASAAKLSGKIKDTFKNWDVCTCLTENMNEPIDILINTSRKKLNNNGELIIPERIIKNSKCVFDTIYEPKKSIFEETADKYGIKNVNGLYMLIFRCALAQQIWIDYDFKIEEVKNLYLEFKEKTKTK